MKYIKSFRIGLIVIAVCLYIGEMFAQEKPGYVIDSVICEEFIPARYEVGRTSEYLHIDNLGNFYYLYGHRLIKNNSMNVFEAIVGSRGDRPNEFSHVSDIFVDEEGRILIADLGLRKVLILNKDLSFNNVIQTQTAYNSLSVTADRSGNFYIINPICDSLIAKYDRNGSFIKYFGKTISDESRSYMSFKNGVDLAVDDENNLWVSYRWRPYIRKYSPEGKLLFERMIKNSITESRIIRENEIDNKREHIHYFDEILSADGKIILCCGCWLIELNVNDGSIIKATKIIPLSGKWTGITIGKISYNSIEKKFYFTAKNFSGFFRFSK